VLRQNQNKILDYVRKNYENVGVLMKDNWMRLDFNHDGKVSFDDIRKGMTELYAFMKNFDFFNTAMEIKSTIYSEAIRMMKKDNKKDDKQDEDQSQDKEDKEDDDQDQDRDDDKDRDEDRDEDREDDDDQEKDEGEDRDEKRQSKKGGKRQSKKQKRQ